MINNKTKKTLIIILTLIIVVLLIQLPSKAASFSGSSSKQTMTVGETANFTVTANGCGGKFSVSSSDSSVVSVEGTLDWTENGSNSVGLKANKAGTATITVTAVSVADSSTAEDITGSRSVTIKVENPAPANNGGVDTSGANLKSITVAGKTFNNPGTDITVTVGADVRAADVKAVANDGNAKIAGTGAKDLITGTNTVTLTVTASNGATKKYTIRIRKLADTSAVQPNVQQNTTPNPEPPPEEETPQIEDLRLEYLRIEDVELIPEFNSEIFEYSVAVTNIDKLDIIAVANVENTEVAITGNNELVEGENEILITITKEGQESVVYRIKVTKTIEQVTPIQEEENNDGVGGFLSTPGGKAVVSIGGAGAVGVLGFIIYKIKSGADVASGAARRAALRKSTFNNFDD